MATPLSDEIRALITYANETTGAGDTKLGDCVKTLVEGYNGGKNLPSSPMVVPQGALSSRLAALLAYANECTGAGDTTMGDAIRTLCEGYGGEQLVFYEKLITDGTAWINTGFIFTSDVASVRVIGKRGAYSGWTSLFGDGQDKGTEVYFYSSRDQIYDIYVQGVRVVTTFNYGTWSDELDITLTSNGTAKTRAIHNNTTNTDYNGTATGASVLTNVPMYLFATNNNGTKSRQQGKSAYIRSCRITEDGVEKMHLVPCTYNGEAGMWDLVSQTFFGNAASSGQFTVEGEIVFYDYLQSDSAAYIETGIGVDTQTFICKAKQEDSTNPVFGATSNFGYKGYSNTNYTRGYNFSSYIQVYVYRYASNIIEYKLDMTGFYAGTTYGAKARGTASGTLKLFSMTGAEYGYAKIYDMKILSVNDELLYHFLPCTCNGVAGMWDMVGWKFYGNSNTSGAFTAENDS